jgi:hypothetical protein
VVQLPNPGDTKTASDNVAILTLQVDGGPGKDVETCVIEKVQTHEWICERAFHVPGDESDEEVARWHFCLRRSQVRMKAERGRQGDEAMRCPLEADRAIEKASLRDLGFLLTVLLW